MTTNRILIVVMVVVCVAIGLVVTDVTRQPSAVPSLTVVNPHPLQLTLDVSGKKGDGWLRIGTAESEASQVFVDVIDQGSEWIFRVSHAGVVGGEFSTTRAQLQRERWRVTVPDSAVRGLR